MFNPNRLILARKRRKMTKKEIANRANISPVTLTRLEKERNPPEPETIEAIAMVLRFPVTFFYGDDLDELTTEAASFRSLSSMTAKAKDAALASAPIAYLFTDWVTERFNLPQTKFIELDDVNTPEGAARSIRQIWGLGEKPISNMIKLLESKGVRVFSLSENTKKVDAFSCWRNETPYVFLNTYKTAEHSRFDAAHELGHLILHKHGGPNQGKEAEREANSFASSFLMPEADVVSNIPFVTSLDQIISQKKRWGVSAAALSYRLHKMGILSDWQYRSICIQLNENGYRTSEPNGIKRETSVVWEKVFQDLWSDRITKTDVAKFLNIPPEELESLLFGLIGAPEKVEFDKQKPQLRII